MSVVIGKLNRKLACLLFGHKRGRFVKEIFAPSRTDPLGQKPSGRSYVCPRCGATWTRKIKPQSIIPDGLVSRKSFGDQK